MDAESTYLSKDPATAGEAMMYNIAVSGAAAHMRRARPLFSDDLMKDDPAVPGGPLKSKPTWLSTFGRLAASAFFSPAVA